MCWINYCIALTIHHFKSHGMRHKCWQPDCKFGFSFKKKKKSLQQNTRDPCDVHFDYFANKLCYSLKYLPSWWLRWSTSNCLADSWTVLWQLHSSSSCNTDKQCWNKLWADATSFKGYPFTFHIFLGKCVSLYCSGLIMTGVGWLCPQITDGGVRSPSPSRKPIKTDLRCFDCHRCFPTV